MKTPVQHPQGRRMKTTHSHVPMILLLGADTEDTIGGMKGVGMISE